MGYTMNDTNNVYCLWATRKIVWGDESEYTEAIHSVYTPDLVLTRDIQKRFVISTSGDVKSELRDFVCDFLKRDSWGKGKHDFIYCGYFRIDVDKSDENAYHNVGFEIIAHK